MWYIAIDGIVYSIFMSLLSYYINNLNVINPHYPHYKLLIIFVSCFSALILDFRYYFYLLVICIYAIVFFNIFLYKYFIELKLILMLCYSSYLYFFQLTKKKYFIIFLEYFVSTVLYYGFWEFREKYFRKYLFLYFISYIILIYSNKGKVIFDFYVIINIIFRSVDIHFKISETIDDFMY